MAVYKINITTNIIIKGHVQKPSLLPVFLINVSYLVYLMVLFLNIHSVSTSQLLGSGYFSLQHLPPVSTTSNTSNSQHHINGSDLDIPVNEYQEVESDDSNNDLLLHGNGLL